MAAKKQEDAQVVEKAATVQTVPEPAFTLDALMESSRSALGVEPDVLAGAFAGEPEGATYTLAQAKAKIDKFMCKPVPIRRR